MKASRPWCYLIIFLIHLLYPSATLASSPQLCYYDTNKIAWKDIIPCYASTTQDDYACCKAGDKYLRHNACFSLDTGVTYQYGCTDSTFRDASCPQKCGLDTEKSYWVGIVFCNGQADLPNDTWVCHHPDNCGSAQDCAKDSRDGGIEKLQDTNCGNVDHEGKYVAFTASSTLSDVVPLPMRTELASWWQVHADRTKATLMWTGLASDFTYPSVSPTASDSTESTVAAPSSTSTSTSPWPIQTSPAQSNRRAATLALSIGIGIGLPIVSTLAGLTIFYMRR